MFEGVSGDLDWFAGATINRNMDNYCVFFRSHVGPYAGYFEGVSGNLDWFAGLTVNTFIAAM